MSEISANDRLCFGNVGLQSHTNPRPKFQPVRVKDLLDCSDSDEDESEDDSEDDTIDSDCKLDFDDPQPLLQKESMHESVNNSLEPLKPFPRPCELKNDIEQSEIIDKTLISDRSSKSEEPKAMDENKGILVGVISETDSHKEVCNNKSDDQAKDNCNATQSDHFPRVHIKGYIEKRINSELRSDIWSSYEGVQTQERITPKDTGNKVTNVENNERFNVNSDCYKSKQSAKDQYQRTSVEINEQPSSGNGSTSELEPITSVTRSCGSTLESTIYNSQSANTKLELSSLSTNEEQSQAENTVSSSKLVLNHGDHLVTETPLKHTLSNSMRPNPCFARRNLAQTPQNKLQMDVSKCHGQTPATILTNWSQNSLKQTPLQNKFLTTKELKQTPKTSNYVTPSTSKYETPRFFSTESKSVRRPLADATGFKQNDTSMYNLDSKSLLLQASVLPKVEEIIPRSQSDLSLGRNPNIQNSTAKRMLEISERPGQVEVTVNEHLRENKHPNASDNREKPLKGKISESKHIIGSNSNHDLKNNLLQMYEKDDKSVSKQTCNNDSQSVYSLSTSHNKNHNHSSKQQPQPQPQQQIQQLHQQQQEQHLQQQQQELRQVVDKISHVQFSMAPAVPKSKQSKTIFVKGKEYLILGTLGRGMSGEVLRVQDLSLGELCAVKCVNLSRMDKDSAQGCLEEISMLHKLQAPCVVNMFDYEIKYPMVYVVMEMGDTDLSRLLKAISQEKQLPLTMILYYWTEILTAVKHIHDNGVIHSDLKPANFLLVRGRLKLIDFGIASSMNADMTSVVKNCPIGTLNYISPEALMDTGGSSDSPTQNVKYKISFKSDVWSLGCILYSLVYGRTPFHHIRSQWAKVNAITNPKHNISFPANLSLGDSAEKSVPTPSVLIDVMRKCLQHDPKARPTVTQLLQISYIPCKPERTLLSTPDIPASVLIKIRHSLTEDEWRQLTQVLENKRHT